VLTVNEAGHGPRIAALGPLRAWAGGFALHPGSPEQRAVLAMLALRAGRPVALGDLVDGVWGAEAPADASGAVRACALRIRRTLALGRTARECRASGSLFLHLVGDGYVLEIDPERVDALVFERLIIRAARMQWRSAGESGDLLDRALALWSGTALTGVVGPFAAAERLRLERLRLSAIELAVLPSAELLEPTR
jgi:DNA-binding SARP family transcriptional activator